MIPWTALKSLPVPKDESIVNVRVLLQVPPNSQEKDLVEFLGHKGNIDKGALSPREDHYGQTVGF